VAQLQGLSAVLAGCPEWHPWHPALFINFFYNAYWLKVVEKEAVVTGLKERVIAVVFGLVDEN
jgi:hypothetical protein